LTGPSPAFSFDDPVRPIYTRPRFLPGSRIYDARLDRALLCDGCIIEGAEIRRSVVGIRSVIGDDVVIEDTVIMGADFYEAGDPRRDPRVPPLGIGRGSSIRGAIIDKNAHIGDHVRIEPFPAGADIDQENWTVRDGIVVVPKHAVLAPGTVIAPQE
jgi:glucose-1-phosphate adenylyltransferase